jgi:hypothetical protein
MIREWIARWKQRRAAGIIEGWKNGDSFDRMCYDVLYLFVSMAPEEQQRAMRFMGAMGCTAEEAAEALGKIAALDMEAAR